MRFVAVLIGALALAGPAQAGQPNPTPGRIVHDLRVASAYWHTAPACGIPPVQVVAIEGDGWADLANCRILLARGHDYRDFIRETCVEIVHEYGHLVLGPDWFADVNPADPAHSPWPESVMYRTTGRPTERLSKQLAMSVGCPPRNR